jgi:thioredoxin 1
MRIFLYLALSTLIFAACKKDIPYETEMVDITSLQQFDTEIAEGVSMIFFHATWCTICKNQRPAVEEVVKDPELEEVFMGEVNYEKVPEIVSKYNVPGFPTIILFKNGVEQERFTGAQNSAASIKAKILPLIN